MAVSAPIRIRVQRAPKIRLRVTPRLIPTDGEDGPPNVLTVGTVEGGDTASATITGSSPSQTLNLVLPKGDAGPANTLSIGTVDSGAAADASITGDAPAQALNLTLPKGDKGDVGDTGPAGAPGVIQALTAGNSVTVDDADPANPVIAVSVGTTAGTVAAGDDARITGAAQKDQNLSDLDDAGAARTNLLIREPFATKAAAEAYAPAVAPDFLRTAGYAAAGDGGGALYKKVAVEPTHAGKLSITLADAVTVVWYEISESIFSPAMFGVVGDLVGVTGTDQSVMLQAMFNAVPAGATIDFGGMSIKCSNTPINITKDIHFVGRGARIFFDNGSYLKVAGTISSPLGSIAAPAVKGSAAFKASTSLSTALDGAKLMILHKHVTGSLNKQRSYYYDGEFQEPLAVSGSTVICTRSLDTTYAGVATDEIYRVDPIVFTAKGITFEADNVTSPWAVWLRFCWQLDIDDAQFIGGQTRSLYVDKCYKGDFRRPVARHTTTGTGTGYGIGFGNSQDITVHDPDCRADNHSISMGGNDENGSVPCRRVVVRGNGRLSNQSTTQSVVDIHGNAVDCGYKDGLTLHGAAGLSGHRTFVRGCKVLCRGGNAPFYLKEVGGGFIEFSDNEVWFDARSATVTITNAAPAVITWSAHSLYLNHPVVFSTTGALPTGLTAGTTYYVSNVIDGDTFTVSATISGAAINTTDAGSGTHTCATVPSDRVMGFTSSAVTALINEDVEFIMDRNKIHSHPGLKYGAFMFWTASRYVDDNNLKPEINWHIRANDNRLVGPITGLTAFISMTAAAAPTPWTYTGLGPNTVTVNDIKTDTPLSNTVNLAQAVSGSFGRTTYTLPEFAISGTITIPSGGYQSGNLTLDHPIYPGVPECSVSGARGFSGANLVDLIELTATLSQRVVRLALAANTLTVAADYSRNVQIRVGMKNRRIS